MKRILSLVIVLSMVLSFASFAAITNVVNFYDQSTGTNYFFGKFEETDEQVGFEIENKEYVLDEEAYKKAQDAGNLFGIGIRDERGILEGTYTATPYSYTGETKTLYEDLAVVASNYTFERNILETLTIKGEEVSAFSPYKSFYHYVLEDGETLSLSDIEAVPAMSLSTSTVTETENGFLVTISSDYAEPKTVEIITVEKGEYQDNQSAPIVGWKNINTYYPEIGNKVYAEEPVVTVLLLKGSTSIYDGDELRMKGPFDNRVSQDGETNPYGLALIQFDISNITNINDRVILNLPARLNRTDYAGEIGVVGVETEAPITKETYYSGSSSQGTGSGSEPYNAALEALTTNPTQSMVNAVSMINLDKVDYEVAPRAQVTYNENANSVETVKSVDVTDYVRSKVLAGEDTVTFVLRAFHNAALSGSMDKEAQVTVATKKATLDFVGYEGNVALSDLKVNGETIKGFDANTNAYSIIVSAGDDVPVVEGFVSDNENLTVSVTQATEVPGTATIKVTAYDGQSKTYTVSFDNPFERGTFELTQKHYLQRNTGMNKFDAWKPDNFTDIISGRVYDSRGVPRDEAILQFTTTAEGLNEDERVILTVAARAQNQLGVDGGSVRIVGIVDENYVYGENTFPVVDANYTFTTTEGLTLDFKEYSFDVTPYVKARLLSGEKKISFLVEIVDSDWKSGDSSVYMDLAVTTYNVLPTLEYKATELTSLTYNGNEIELVEGQKAYTVVLDNNEIPVVEATALNSTVEVAQAISVPGTATVTVNTNGDETQYKVNFITADYVGTATATNVFYATRSNSNLRFDATLTQGDLTNANASVQVRTDNSTKIRQEGSVVFNVEDLLGINENQKVILTVYGYGNAAAIDAATKVQYRGISGEGIQAGGKYGTDTTYIGESDIVLTNVATTAYKLDVTEYVKSKLAKGESTVSIAIRVPEGGNATTFYWYYGGDRTPTLTVE